MMLSLECLFPVPEYTLAAHEHSGLDHRTPSQQRASTPKDQGKRICGNLLAEVPGARRSSEAAQPRRHCIIAEIIAAAHSTTTGPARFNSRLPSDAEHGAYPQLAADPAAYRMGLIRLATGGQPAAADRTADAIPYWMARLLRFLPDPTCAHGNVA
jgi:hypothetical protein